MLAGQPGSPGETQLHVIPVEEAERRPQPVILSNARPLGGGYLSGDIAKIVIARNEPPAGWVVTRHYGPNYSLGPIVCSHHDRREEGPVGRLRRQLRAEGRPTRPRNPLPVLHPHRDHLGHAGLLHGDAVESVGAGHGAAVVGDEHELGVFGHGLDQV